MNVTAAGSNFGRRFQWIVALTAVAVTGAVPAALAQGTPQEGTPPVPTAPTSPTAPPPAAVKQPARFQLAVTSQYRYVFERDLEDTETGVQVSRRALDLSLNYGLTPRLLLSGGLSFENSRYDFDRFEALVPGVSRPIEDGRMFTFTPGFRYILSPKWSVGANAILRYAGEDDADEGDARESGVAAYGSFAVNERLRLTFGLISQSQIEEDDIITPILGVDWRITPKSRFVTQGLPNGFSGQYVYRASSKVSAYFRGSYERRNFRLKDSGPLANGVFRDYGFPLEVGALWQPTNRAEITASVGYVVGQQYRLDDPDGNERLKKNQDGAPFLGLSAKWKL